jgi:hypothetical protein
MDNGEMKVGSGQIGVNASGQANAAAEGNKEEVDDL